MIVFTVVAAVLGVAALALLLLALIKPDRF